MEYVAFRKQIRVVVFSPVLIGQWGLPTVSLPAVIAVMPAVIGSTIESIGDYYATARVVGKLPIPGHALNRGM